MKNEKPMRSSFSHASAILFSSVLVHLCVVNSTVNEWSDSMVVCATSCKVTQRGKFCKHTRMLCKHFFAWVRAKSRGFAPVSCVYCKPAFTVSMRSTRFSKSRMTICALVGRSTGKNCKFSSLAQPQWRKPKSPPPPPPSPSGDPYYGIRMHSTRQSFVRQYRDYAVDDQFFTSAEGNGLRTPECSSSAPAHKDLQYDQSEHV